MQICGYCICDSHTIELMVTMVTNQDVTVSIKENFRDANLLCAENAICAKCKFKT